ncbi:MAG: DUF5818 domain-containing protein [Bryobacterales bacterium]|nr:DUF5818 domain-containing protein [Bryobacterales bacterium]
MRAAPLLALAAQLLLPSGPLQAAPGAVTGYVSDEACARDGGGPPACARRCIEAGSVAVLLTRGGRIYRVDDQRRIAEWAGRTVSVSGDIRGRRIVRIDSVAEIRVRRR